MLPQRRRQGNTGAVALACARTVAWETDHDRALRLDAVVIGGAALNLLGVVSRPTKDCDILYPQLPAAIAEAARAFAAELRRRGQVLADDWLNNGPASLADQLPSRWQRRLRDSVHGPSNRPPVTGAPGSPQGEGLRTERSGNRPQRLPGARAHDGGAGRDSSLARATGYQSRLARTRQGHGGRPGKGGSAVAFLGRVFKRWTRPPSFFRSTRFSSFRYAIERS